MKFYEVLLHYFCNNLLKNLLSYILFLLIQADILCLHILEHIYYLENIVDDELLERDFVYTMPDSLKVKFKKSFTLNFDVKAEYTLYGKIAYILPEFEVKIIDTEFSENVIIKMLVRSEYVTGLEEKLIDIANGNITFVKGDETAGDFA